MCFNWSNWLVCWRFYGSILIYALQTSIPFSMHFLLFLQNIHRNLIDSFPFNKSRVKISHRRRNWQTLLFLLQNLWVKFNHILHFFKEYEYLHVMEWVKNLCLNNDNDSNNKGMEVNNWNAVLCEIGKFIDKFNEIDIAAALMQTCVRLNTPRTVECSM